MKRTLCILLTVPLFLGAETTSAAVAAPAQEPVNGFTRGPNPEWSTAHVQAHEDREDHRRYHQRMETEHRAWLRNHAEDEDADAYTTVYRSLRENFNGDHREAHRVSDTWHFQYGERVFALEQEGTSPATVVPFVRTGRPQTARKSRRVSKQDFYDLQRASRPTRS